MPYYKVTDELRYHEEHFIEASDSGEAKQKALGAGDATRIYDDTLIDSEVEEISEEEFKKETT